MNGKKVFRAGIAAALAAVCVAGTWRHCRLFAGDPSPRLGERWHQGHQVVDRQGRLLRELTSDSGQRGRSLRLDQLGDRIVLATLISEDRDFYSHEGVDAQAVVRAMTQNIRHGRLVSGASTITQQLVKLLDSAGTPRPKGLADKLKEAARAQNLEDVLGKEAILEAYLNRLSYGNGLTGPEAAAQGYFGVASRDLSYAQAAFLAVLPRAPSYLNPFVHHDRVILRQRALLDAMHSEGVLTDADHARAVAEAVQPRRRVRPFFAPHLVEALRSEGKLFDGPLTPTTLDLDLQRDVEGLVQMHLASIHALGADNAAVLVADNATGDVLSYAGSADFYDIELHGQVDMVRARRQPGSTLKPFVYALAFARGHSAEEMLADVPTTFAEAGRGSYAPRNFDGGFEGPISAREALGGSFNIPVVRLAADLPPGGLLDSLRAWGFASLDQDAAHYGLALVLGSGEVTLQELTTAYMTLARGGDRIALRFALAAAPSSGSTPQAPVSPAVEGERVIDREVAALVTDILSDPLARVRGLHGRGPFDLGFPVAVKTGTSSGFRDTWTVGYTRERTVAVWVGHTGGGATQGLTGASGAGPLFADVMRRAMHDIPASRSLSEEGLLVDVEVCPLSGELPGPACPEHTRRRFIRGHVPEHACDVHKKAHRVRATGPEPPFRCDAGGNHTIVVLPPSFDGWLAGQHAGAPGMDRFGFPWFPSSRVPGCAVPSHRTADLHIDQPAPGSVFLLSPSGRAEDQMIELSASLGSGQTGAQRALDRVEFVVDGKVVARSGWPFRARIPAVRGDHEVLALPADPSVSVRVEASSFSVR